MSVKISTSEALSYGSCQRKHMYAFHPAYNLEAKYQGKAITRGLLGHEALQVYYEALQGGKSLGEAKEVMMLFLGNKMVEFIKSEQIDRLEIVSELSTLLQEYVDSDVNLKFVDSTVILGVEYGMEVQLPYDLILPTRLDLLVKFTKGEWKGETVPVDHKFVYNFWTDGAFQMNTQIPNYIYVTRQSVPGAVVRRGIINQIRWRNTTAEKFKMTDVSFSKREVQELITNHINLSTRAARFKSLPVEEARDEATRTISKFNCENCSFRNLCKLEMTGGNVGDLIRMDFQRNSYGYDKNEDEN